MSKSHRSKFSQDRTASVITYVVIIGVAIITIAAFTLSFDALRSMSAANGIHFSWLFPVALDLAMLTYSLASLVHEMRGQPSGFEKMMVGSMTAVSIILNALSGVVHPVLKIAIDALPPIFVGVAIHVILRLIHNKPKVVRAA